MTEDSVLTVTSDGVGGVSLRKPVVKQHVETYGLCHYHKMNSNCRLHYYIQTRLTSKVTHVNIFAPFCLFLRFLKS
jgi:hypothetical protein